MLKDRFQDLQNSVQSWIQTLLLFAAFTCFCLADSRKIIFLQAKKLDCRQLVSISSLFAAIVISLCYLTIILLYGCCSKPSALTEAAV